MSTIKTVLLVGMLIISGTFSSWAADVTITVNGRVVATPCTVSTPSATVDLGGLSSLNYVRAGSSSGWYPVRLNLTNCPAGVSIVTATFSGTSDSTGYYKNLGEASNIQLELQDEEGNNLSNGKQKPVNIDDTSSSATLPLRVRVLSINGNATPGSIRSIIDVMYTYA